MKCSLNRSLIKDNLSDSINKRIMDSEFFSEDYTLLDDRGKKIISNINRDYKTEVAKLEGNKLQINIPEKLISQYAFSHPEGKDLVYQEIVNSYLSYFPDGSLNLAVEDKFINHPLLENPSVEALLNFARKINPNFQVAVVDNLPAKALSLIRDNIIIISERHFFDEFPEEIAHFFVELLPEDSQIYKDLIEQINNFSIYSETYRKYKDNPAYQKDGKPNIKKIKKEAAAKLIAKYIKDASVNKAEETFGKEKQKVANWFDKFMKFLRRMFSSIVKPIYPEPVIDINNPFKNSAEEILRGDISHLDISKPISIYDSYFYSLAEENMAEVTESNIFAKALSKFSNAMKRKLTKTFLTFAADKKFEALLDELKDDRYHSYNRLFDAINLLKEVDRTFGFFDDVQNVNVAIIAEATEKLAESFAILQEVPKALEAVLKKLKTDIKNNTLSENELINNITELQHYMKFVETFNRIEEDFIRLLNGVKENEELDNSIYENMVEIMDTTSTRFKEVNEAILNIVKDYTKDLMILWTNNLFEKYSKDVNDRIGQATIKNVQLKLLKQIEENFTSSDHIAAALSGNLDKLFSKSILMKNGEKLDLSKIKDISNVDYFMFLVSAPSLMSDPFLSNLLAFYVDRKYSEGVKASQEGRIVANKGMELIDSIGGNYYEAQEKVQTVQNFMVQGKEEPLEKRTFIDQIDRHTLNYDLQKMILQREEDSRQLGLLRLKKKNLSLNIKEGTEKGEDITKYQEEYDKVSKELPEKELALNKLREDIKIFRKTYYIQEFTDDYYEIIGDENKDSQLLKDIKKQKFEVLQLQSRFLSQLDFDNINEELRMQISREMSKLVQMEMNLPAFDKEKYDRFSKLFVDDEVNTERAMAQHQNMWVNSSVREAIKRGDNRSKEDLKTFYNNLWKTLFMVEEPTQKFWDDNKKRWEEFKTYINNHLRNPEIIVKQIDKLYEQRLKLLKGVRGITGEVFIIGMEGVASPVSDNPLYKDLYLNEVLLDSLKEKVKFLDRVNYNSIKNVNNINAFSLGVDLYFLLKLIRDNNIPDSYILESLNVYTDANQELVDFVKQEIRKDPDNINYIVQHIAKYSKKEYEGEFGPLSRIAYSSLDASEEFIYNLLQTFSYKTDQEKAAINVIMANINEYSDRVTSDSYVSTMLPELLDLYEELAVNKNFKGIDDIYRNQVTKIVAYLKNINYANIHFINELQDVGFLNKKYFEILINYVKYKESLGEDVVFSSDFIEMSHKEAKRYNGTTYEQVYTPMSFYTKISPKNSDDVNVKPAKFLRRSKVAPEFITEKIKETDERVINGTKEATIDINGQWLPLKNRKVKTQVRQQDGTLKQDEVDNKYWNNNYQKLSKKELELLNYLKIEYLKFQEQFLPEGQRLDTVLPSRMFDSYESKKALIQSTKEIKSDIEGFFSLRKADETSSTVKLNFDEELGVRSKSNYDIYTGAVLSEMAVKLNSSRNIPLHKVSKDVLSSILFFIDDIHEYRAKEIAVPIFKAFSDVFHHVNHLKPEFNKKRAEVLKLFIDTRLLDEVPDGFANNPTLARILKVLRTLSTNKLLLDPLGAIINFSNGQFQVFIENGISKQAWINFSKSEVEAGKWLFNYDKDALLFTQQKLSVESQLIDILGMIPEGINISERMSKYGLAADLRTIMMQPRQQTEVFMGVQLGLMIIAEENIMFKGKKVNFRNLYELDENGNVRLKKEYADDEDFNKEWNIIDGKGIERVRKKMINLYTMLQGNFYDFNQSYISNTAIGKSIELMKRWFISGYVRRFQGMVLDPFLGSEREGYHYTMINFLINAGRLAYSDGSKGVSEYYKLGLSKKQKHNLAKSAAEAVYIFLVGLFLASVLMYDSDDEDKNKKLKQMTYWQKVAVLITLRAKSELGTFIPLPFFGLGLQETFRAFLDPLSVIKGSVLNSAGTAKLIVDQIMYSVGFDIPEKNLQYQKQMSNSIFPMLSFKDKGDYKIFALIANTFGYTGYTFDPESYIKTIDSLMSRIK